MAFAWPLAVRDSGPRARPFGRASSGASRRWLRVALPFALIGGGALLLSPPWRSAPPPAAAPSPFAPSGGEPLALLGALLVVGGALAALPWIVARVGARARGGGQIALLEVRPLGGRRSLMLVEVGRRRFLIGASEQGLARLAELDAAKSYAQVASEAEREAGGAG